MIFFARHAVAATTLAVAGFSAAQAQPVASMQLDLTDLKVEVVSLVPGAPAVQPPTISLFSSEDPLGSSPAMVGLQSTILRTSGETATFWDSVPVSSSLWPTQSLVHLSSDGLSQTFIDPAAISMRTTLTEQALQSVLPSQGLDLDQGFSSYVSLTDEPPWYVTIPANANANANAWRLTLAPQSQLTMSGVSNVSMNMDVESVSRLLSSMADSETVPSLALVAGIYLNAQILDPVDGVSANYENMPGTAIQYFFDTDQAFQWSGAITGPVVHTQDNFKMTLRNELDVETTFLVHMVASNQTGLFRSGRPPHIDNGGGVVPEVPEPSTYALMGLGLMALAAVARKGRLNKPH